MVCWKLVVVYLLLLFRYLFMIVVFLYGCIYFNFQEFWQQNYLSCFLYVLGLLELLQLYVFCSEYQGVLWDCFLFFICLLLNYRKFFCYLVVFINKFVQFIYKYIIYNVLVVIFFLQKYVDLFYDLFFDNSDLVMLKFFFVGFSLFSRDDRID